MKQTYLTTILLIMLISMTGAKAFAHDIMVMNEYGVYICYSFINNKTELAVARQESSSSTFYSGNIVIPESVIYDGNTYKVTSIEYGAFYGCSDLTSVTIPNSVTSIGKDAFYECSGLTSVHISDLAAWCKIKFEGFSYYSNPLSCAHHLYLNGKEIKDLVIPNSVTKIGNYTFAGCYGLTSVTIPNSVTSIGYGAFGYCSSLTSVTIPNSVTSIGDQAFYECSGLTIVTIGNSVTSIGSWAFGYCSSLTSVTIGNSVTSIGNNAFRGCSGLTSVTIPNSVTSIGMEAFYACSGLTSVTIPNSVTSMGDGAFESCIALTSVTIPNSVTSIGKNAFRGCSSLTSVTIPNSVTSIGSWSFGNCRGLTSVTIGNSVKTIGNGVFAYCSALTTLYALNTIPPSVGSDSFTDDQYKTVNVFVPQGALEAYQNAEIWKNFWNMQGDPTLNVERINFENVGADNIYYDLRGNRLDTPKRGVNIINGKKVMMKQ